MLMRLALPPSRGPKEPPWGLPGAPRLRPRRRPRGEEGTSPEVVRSRAEAPRCSPATRERPTAEGLPPPPLAEKIARGFVVGLPRRERGRARCVRRAPSSNDAPAPRSPCGWTRRASWCGGPAEGSEPPAGPQSHEGRGGAYARRGGHAPGGSAPRRRARAQTRCAGARCPRWRRSSVVPLSSASAARLQGGVLLAQGLDGAHRGSPRSP